MRLVESLRSIGYDGRETVTQQEVTVTQQELSEQRSFRSGVGVLLSTG